MEATMTTLALLLASALALPQAPGGPEGDILKVIEKSADDWNAGSLDGFLGSYADSPDTLFIGSTGLLRGFAAIKAHYLESYGAQKGGMGHLTFDSVEVHLLGADHALAVGRWNVVKAGDPKPASGYFTLTFGRTSAGWRIVCDHTH
jgi:ketosteroid isomerase-like protein